MGKVVLKLLQFSVVIGVVGGALGWYFSGVRNQTIEKAETMYAYEFRSNKKHSSIVAIPNASDSLKYLLYIKDSLKTLNFRFVDIEEGTTVKVLEKSESGLFRILVINSVPISTKPPREEYWIFKKFLRKGAQNSGRTDL